MAGGKITETNKTNTTSLNVNEARPRTDITRSVTTDTKPNTKSIDQIEPSTKIEDIPGESR